MRAGIKGHIETMKAAVLLLVFLTLSGTVLSWDWHIHVTIYLIARNAILPYDIWNACNRCRDLMKDAEEKRQAEDKARREAEEEAKKEAIAEQGKEKKEEKREEKKKEERKIEKKEDKKKEKKPRKQEEIEAEIKEKLLCEKVMKGLQLPMYKFIYKRMRILNYIDKILDRRRLAKEAKANLQRKGRELLKDTKSPPTQRSITKLEKRAEKYVLGEKGYDKYLAAYWANDGTNVIDNHYLHQVYIGRSKEHPIEILNKENNVITAYKKAYNFLIQLGKMKTKPLEDKAHMMAYLIHLMGDMHQPLHMIKRYYQTDKGWIDDDNGFSFGLLLSLANSTYDLSLFKYWNAAAHIYDFMTNYTPISALNRVSMKSYRDLAQEIMELFPISRFISELKIKDFNKFANKMFLYGVNDVYGEIGEKDNSMMKDEEYAKKARYTCAELIALAGYRLAAAFVEIYSENNPPNP